MPETAPLDVNDSTVGYELDSITLRNICSVRYVRHHEWLDHLLESPLAPGSIVPDKVGSSFNVDLIDSRIKQLHEEIAQIDAESERSKAFYVNEKKTAPLAEATRELSRGFGTDNTAKVQQDLENALNMKIVRASTMQPVPVTYNRRESEYKRAEEHAIEVEKEEQHRREHPEEHQYENVNENRNENENKVNSTVGDHPEQTQNLADNSPGLPPSQIPSQVPSQIQSQAPSQIPSYSSSHAPSQAPSGQQSPMGSLGENPMDVEMSM